MQQSRERLRAWVRSWLHLRLLRNQGCDGAVLRCEVQSSDALHVGRGHCFDPGVAGKELLIIALENLESPQEIRPALDGLQLAIEVRQNLVLRLAQLRVGY